MFLIDTLKIATWRITLSTSYVCNIYDTAIIAIVDVFSMIHEIFMETHDLLKIMSTMLGI